jgi:hypothetical protein
MRKEITLPIAERMEAARERRPAAEDFEQPRPFTGQAFRKVVKEEDTVYEADRECISAT